MAQDYSTNAVYDWTPASAGTYKISVHIKDHHSTKAYDDYKAFEYLVQ